MISLKIFFSPRILTITVLLFTVLLQVPQLMAADRLFFSGLVSHNDVTSALDVTLIWGEFEGNVPEAVDSFNIYRKLSSETTYPATPLVTIDRGLLSVPAITEIFHEDGELTREEELIVLLNKDPGKGDTDIDSNSLPAYLHGIMDPSSPDYNSYKRHLLIRYNRNVARAAGFAWLDRAVPAGYYTYMLTANIAGSETNPLGISTVNATAPTILPAPTNFRQVILSVCDDLSREIDQNKVYLNWHVPSEPSEMSHSAMIYGYDLFRSKRDDLETPDFNITVHPEFTKVNELTILASGNTAPETRDDYLARDEDDSLHAGEVYFYYLVARDLNGVYSAAAGPLRATVADRRGPVMPWNVHSYRNMTAALPRLMLAWDEINTINYLKQYKTGKTLCSATETELCFVPEGDSCTDPEGDSRAICVDLDVQEYRIYRYDSPFAAKGKGTDSDGDGWFDEDDSEPCNPEEPSSGTPPDFVASLSGETLAAARVTLASGKSILTFIDPFPQDDNRIYWYRLTSVDSNGNPSPLSPPARAALWDRSQPDAAGTLLAPKCNYIVNITPGTDENTITVVDATEDAASFRLYENVHCVPQDQQGLVLISEDSLVPETPVSYSSGDFYGYTAACEEDVQLLVHYYDANSKLIAESQPVMASAFPDSNHIITLLEDCVDQPVTGSGSGSGSIIPDQPLVKICGELANGECARVYEQIAGKMYPLESFCYNDPHTFSIPNVDGTCINLEQRPGIVPSRSCLGLRVFSKNHVGSGLHYFDCLQINANSSAGPPAPVMTRMEPQGTAAAPGFKILWGSLPDGVAAFTLEGRSGDKLKQKTIWNPEQDGEGGSYSTTVPIQSSEIQEEWCFQVRMLDKTLRASPWSQEICREWGSPGTSDHLGWPTVPEPPTDSGVTAFFLEDANAGALFLSDPMNVPCESSPDMNCTGSQLDSCVAGRLFVSCGDESFLCSDIKAANKYGDFIVYRQEENKEFIQVSPMVNDIHCFDADYNYEVVAHLFDPLVYLVELNSEKRLIFVDWAPHKSGSKVRYQLVRLDKLTGEPIGSVVSDWVQF